jgi:hypothetical protein
MAKKSKWLLGCGLGCAGFLVLIVLVVMVGISLRRTAMRSFEAAEAIRVDLEKQFGAPDDFVPAADGAIPAERLEIFLSVREATQEYRTRIARFFSSIPMDEETGQEPDSRPFREKVGTVFQRMKSAVGMSEDMGHLFEARNRALLDRGMGLGEYTYIYVLAYYSWLGHSIDDGPGRNANRSFVITRSRSRMHRDLLKMLSNQLSALAESGEDEASSRWRSELTGEIEAMENNEERLPWEDSVPRNIAESLEPFRDRLERSYSPLTNPFELSLPARRDLLPFGRE